MANNWGTTVQITVPKGTNGWQQTGRVRVNGRDYKFPIGVQTQLPKPVAEYVQALIDQDKSIEEAKKRNPFSTPHQVFVTDGDGNPVWEDRTHGGGRTTVEWDGTCDNSTDTPGTGSTSMLNGICRYWKISDLVPEKVELFAADVEVEFTGTKASNVIDGQVEGDGYYGRWLLPGMPPYSGEYPCVLVVVEPAIISDVGYKCWEPGVYALMSSKGKALAVQSLTYGWLKQLDPKYLPEDHINGLIDSKLEGAGGGESAGVTDVYITLSAPLGASGTYTSNITFEELAAKVENDGWGAVNIRVDRGAGYWIPIYISEYMPNWFMFNYIDITNRSGKVVYRNAMIQFNPDGTFERTINAEVELTNLA